MILNVLLVSQFELRVLVKAADRILINILRFFSSVKWGYFSKSQAVAVNKEFDK